MQEILRPLAPMEYGYFLMDIAVRNNFTFLASVKPGIPLPVLAEAARVVQARHPLLKACIVMDGKNPVFARSVHPVEVGPAAPAESEEPGATTRELLVEAEQGRRFDVSSGPLFRVAAAAAEDGQDILLTFHHSVADGLFGAHLAGELLAAADALLSGSRPETAPLEELGPAEARFDPRYRSAGKTAGLMFRSTGAMIKKAFGGYGRLPLDSKVPPARRRERFVLGSFTEEESAGLMSRARAAGVSLHSLVSAAQLMAEAAEIDREKPSTLVHLSLVDLRKRLSPPVSPGHANVYIAAAECALSVAPDGDPAELAQRISQGLAREMEKGSHFVLMPKLTEMMKKSAFLNPPTPEGAARVLAQGEISRPRVSPVSNLGALPVKNGFRNFSLSGLSFVMALSGTSHFGSTILTFGRRLFWNFSYASPSLSRQRAKKMAERARGLLLRAA